MYREVTKREIAFSVIILLIMIAIGIFITDIISDHYNEKEQMYLSAVQIDQNQSQFEYAMNTNFGNSLVYGKVVAETPVSFDEISGSYLAIKKYREDYNMHTRVVTYTDSKGNVHSRTEIYYSWDLMQTQTKESEKVYFLDNLFDSSIFDFNNYERLDLDGILNATQGTWLGSDDYWYENSDRRYYYRVIPTEFYGTLFSYLGDNTIKEIDDTEFMSDSTIQEFIEAKSDSAMFALIIFWLIWVFLTGGIIALFYYIDNRWLEG